MTKPKKCAVCRKKCYADICADCQMIMNLLPFGSEWNGDIETRNALVSRELKKWKNKKYHLKAKFKKYDERNAKNES